MQLVLGEEDSGQAHPGLSFKRRKTDPRLEYVVQVSTDRQTWLSGPDHVETVSVQDLDAEFERVTCRDRTPALPGQSRFLRLHVLRN